MIKNDFHRAGVVKSLGLVFGDIGTSAIYTLAEPKRLPAVSAA